MNRDLAEAITSGGADIALLTDRQVQCINLSADMAERATTAVYPAVHLYCERLTNSLGEKFRCFSGQVQLLVEIRTSSDKPETLTSQTHVYVDALTAVLTRARGRWGDGIFYTGTYDVVFQPIRKGGRAYMQTAKIQVQVNISI
jgi:hypothetical protein